MIQGISYETFNGNLIAKVVKFCESFGEGWGNYGNFLLPLRVGIGIWLPWRFLRQVNQGMVLFYANP